LIMRMIKVRRLIAGMFRAATASIILLARIFRTMAVGLGYGRGLFGVRMRISIWIALLTPPAGMDLFVAESIGEVSFENLTVRVFPMIILLIILLIIFIIFPQIIMFLPNLLNH